MPARRLLALALLLAPACARTVAVTPVAPWFRMREVDGRVVIAPHAIELGEWRTEAEVLVDGRWRRVARARWLHAERRGGDVVLHRGDDTCTRFRPGARAGEPLTGRECGDGGARAAGDAR